MHIEALDHVNIICTDLDASARFYADLFGLARRDAPPPLTPQTAQWMYDRDDRAVLHLNSTDCERAYDRDVRPGATGAIHHVALRAQGYDEFLRRVQERGLDHQVNDVTAIGLRQVFLKDPNEVLLEINFFAGQ